MYVCMYVRIYVCVCACLPTCVRVCVRACECACACMVDISSDARDILCDGAWMSFLSYFLFPIGM